MNDLRLSKYIAKYWTKEIEEMSVKDAKLAFDVAYEHLCEDCLEAGIESPSWPEAFGLWVGV